MQNEEWIHPGLCRVLNSIIVGDAVRVMRLLPEESIHLIVTSPPYNVGRPYDSYNDQRPVQEFFLWLQSVWEECHRLLVPGGKIAVVIRPLYSDHYPTHHIITSQMQALGMQWTTEIVWRKLVKGDLSSWGSWMSPTAPYFRSPLEYIEVFAKKPFRRKPEKKEVDISKEEFLRWTVTLWDIPPELRMGCWGHPAMFPEEIPHRLIKLLSYKNDVVLDPFNGAGTTTAVAHKLGRHFIGIDISPAYCQIAFRRVLQQAIQPHLFDLDAAGNVVSASVRPRPLLLCAEDLVAAMSCAEASHS